MYIQSTTTAGLALADDVSDWSPGPGDWHDGQLVAAGAQGRGAGVQPRQHQVVPVRSHRL